MDSIDPHQQQYQYQYPQQDQSTFDPSQSQSYEAYYAYHHHHQQQQQYNSSAYHHHYDYSSAQTYPQPAAAPTAAQLHDPSQIQGYAAPQEQSSYPAAEGAGAGEGMNPVAALSHLSEYAGSMDAAERAAMAERQWRGIGNGGPHHQFYQYPHHNPMEQGHVSIRPRGGGRRGSAPFRGGGRRGGGGGGGGRGNSSHHHPPSFRGRGRGRGRMGQGGGSKPHQPSTDSQPTDSPVVGPSLEPGVEQPAPQTAAAATRPKQRPHPLLTWCDICRVDCNSLEILEQHKNGKRHKKTVQRFEEIQRQQKLYGELHGNLMPSTTVPSAGVGEVANKVSSESENIPNSGIHDIMPTSINSEPEANKVQAAEGHLESSKLEEPPRATDMPSSAQPIAEEPLGEGGSIRQPRNNALQGGMKRKMMKFGQGGKRLKSFKPARGRAPERPRERSRVCTLCNVMCETLTVFESHIAGKKHIAKLKRFQGQSTVYGLITVYIPPNQPSAYPTQGQEPLFFGLKSHEMIQQEIYAGMNSFHPENYGHHHGDDQGMVGGNPQVGMNSLQAEHYRHQHGDNLGEVGRNPEGALPESSQAIQENEVVPAITGEPETTVTDATESQVAAVLDVEPKEQTILETEAAFRIGEDAVTLPECGTSLGNNVDLSGLDANTEQLSGNIEEFGDGAGVQLQ